MNLKTLVIALAAAIAAFVIVGVAFLGAFLVGYLRGPKTPPTATA